MKAPRYGWVLTIMGAVIASLLALAMLFVEGVGIFTNISSLYEDVGRQSIRLLSRALCMIIILANVVISIIALKKGGAIVTTSMMLNFSGLIISLLCFIFYEWYLAVGLMVGNGLLITYPIIALTKNRFFTGAQPNDK